MPKNKGWEYVCPKFCCSELFSFVDALLFSLFDLHHLFILHLPNATLAQLKSGWTSPFACFFRVLFLELFDQFVTYC